MEWPDLGAEPRDAGDDPEAARARVAAVAAGLPARAVPEFLEHACREFRAAGHGTAAAALFGLAREVEAAHHRLLGLVPDHARVHRVLLELVPAGVITPELVRGHLAGLAARPDAAAAHAEARELAEAFVAAGSVPYFRFVADLVAVAEAAGGGRDAEEDFLAERLLRGGLLPATALPVWEALAPALDRLCGGSAELLDLLIAAEPDTGRYEAAVIRARFRREWLDRLAAAGAGARLAPEWFAALGPAPAEPLARLAGQAAGRLFPRTPADGGDPGRDPAVSAVPEPSALALMMLHRRGGTRVNLPHENVAEWLAGRLEEDPAGSVRDLYGFVGALGTYSNIDYPAMLSDAWERPEVRAVLEEQSAAWTAEAAAGDLLGLELALPLLNPLAGAGFAALGRDVLTARPITDPQEALLRALRTGIPEELEFPALGPRNAEGPSATVIQHGGLLTIASGETSVEARSADGTVAYGDVRRPDGFHPWYDGEHWYVSRLHEGVWQTFRAAGDGELSAAPEAVGRRPEAPAEAEVTFPGAAAPGRVLLRDGLLHLVAPDGAPAGRLQYGPVQSATAPGGYLLPPPGWWPLLPPVDPEGSAALRGIGRETVERLIEAALRGQKARTAELDRLLPRITTPRLRQGVEGLVQRAADCLTGVLRLHGRAGTEPPGRVPALVRTEPGRPAAAPVTATSAIRVLSEILTEAAGARRLDRAYPLDPVELPPGTGGLWFTFGRLGGKALLAAWPWTSGHERTRLLDALRAWRDTPWGDGGGHWRQLRYRARAGVQRPEGEVWSTPNGALLVIGYQGQPHREATAVEYSPDGRFEPFDLPGWAPYGTPLPQGWGGGEAIARFDRLLAERGPAPYDLAGVRELAGRIGVPVEEVATACFGWPYYAGHERDVPRYPREVLDLYHDPATGERIRITMRGRRLEIDMREVMMPADPAELWERGLDVDRIAAWWEAGGKDSAPLG
ncbi:hypothetical protein [Spirillospora sp. NPDC029432]|uniref:hypothetical protein n=1 Tax=Spirillospora sp. NPDC029432 TaxID=3154599 RepID=UPI00345196EE